MPGTIFVDKSTPIVSAWLNPVDRAVFDAIGDGSTAPQNPATVKVNLELDNVDNTSDLNKPISTATQAAIDAEVATLEATDLLRVPRDSATGAASIPTGTTAERPGSPAQGMLRRNSQLGQWEGYNGTSWDVIPDSSGVITLTTTQTIQNKTLDSTNNISAASGHHAGFRNKIINGAFAINQRAYVSSAATSAGQYTLDRWKVTGTGGITFSTVNNKTTVTIPAGQALQQVIEGLNLATGTYVLSWEGTAQGRIGGGSYGASGTVTASITGGTNTTIEFNTGTVANVQLEAGSIATPFEHRPYGLELSLCQRYFEAGSFSANGYMQASTSNITVQYTYKVTKRIAVTPTASGTSGSTISNNALSNGDTGAFTIMLATNGSGSGNAFYSGYWTASAEL